jgi:hypothetical protein
MPNPIKTDQMASGVASLTAASINVVTGLPTVSSVIASLQDDVVAATAYCSAAPHATPGTITIKGWTAAGAAATTFPKNVSWIAFA